MIPIMTFEKRIETEQITKNSQGKSFIKTEVSYEIEKNRNQPF